MAFEGWGKACAGNPRPQDKAYIDTTIANNNISRIQIVFATVDPNESAALGHTNHLLSR